MKQQDPLALAFIGAALALLAGLLLYVVLFKKPEPAAAGAPGTLDSLRKAVESAFDQPRDKPAPVPPQRAANAPPPAKAADNTGWPVWLPPEGMTWVYRVTLEPPVWQDAVLEYRTIRRGGALVVLTEFRHAKGSMSFELGTVARGHPSHANMRFPGFFLYTTYFGDRIRLGQKIAWEWPWQLPGGGIKAGRVKRYEGTVVEAASNPGPVEPGTTLLKIDGTLSYIEDGRVEARAREMLWYSGKSGQLARVERVGRTPDENATRIVAQLVELR